MSKRPGADHESAAELLGDWRAAGRDLAAAQAAAEVAALALVASKAAEEAAAETEAAAKAASEAVGHATAAAAAARRASIHAADAARMIFAASEGDKARANQEVELAKRAEHDAGDRFHEAQDRGFPKDSD